MMLRAWDGEKFRMDFVVTATGEVWSADSNGQLNKVKWEVTDAIDGIRDHVGNPVYYGDVISDGPYKYAIRNTIHRESGNQWSSGPCSKLIGVTLPLGRFNIIGNKWQTPEIWKDATWLDHYQK